MREIDVLVIGAGPGGYPAAIRSAQLGNKVILVEKGYIGGECLNWGCIPSKALISASDFYYRMLHKSSEMGIEVEGVKIDILKLQDWKERVQSKLINGIKQLLKGNKVEVIMGTAKFVNNEIVQIVFNEGETEEIKPKNIILATGSQFSTLPDIKIDDNDILSAKGILELKVIPENFVIIGGGIIGIELGTVFAKLGSKVTIVEIMPDLIRGLDPMIIKILKKRLSELNVTVLTNTKVDSVVRKGKNFEVTVEETNEKKTLVADKVMVSVGKRANFDDLELSKTGIKLDERGFISTNLKQQTSIPHIYAVGDCTGGPFLAHRATKQGVIAAEVLSGQYSEADFKAMPGAIFTDPEIAFVGLTEEEAKAEGFKVITTLAPFAASGRAMTTQDEEGFVKAVVDEENGILLGVQIIGPHASDLISEVSLALEMGATSEDIGFTVHPHPTLPEMIMEALEAAQGKAIHVANPKKKKEKHQNLTDR